MDVYNKKERSIQLDINNVNNLYLNTINTADETKIMKIIANLNIDNVKSIYLNNITMSNTHLRLNDADKYTITYHWHINRCDETGKDIYIDGSSIEINNRFEGYNDDFYIKKNTKNFENFIDVTKLNIEPFNYSLRELINYINNDLFSENFINPDPILRFLRIDYDLGSVSINLKQFAQDESEEIREDNTFPFKGETNSYQNIFDFFQTNYTDLFDDDNYYKFTLQINVDDGEEPNILRNLGFVRNSYVFITTNIDNFLSEPILIDKNFDHIFKDYINNLVDRKYFTPNPEDNNKNFYDLKLNDGLLPYEQYSYFDLVGNMYIDVNASFLTENTINLNSYYKNYNLIPTLFFDGGEEEDHIIIGTELIDDESYYTKTSAKFLGEKNRITLDFNEPIYISCPSLFSGEIYYNMQKNDRNIIFSDLIKNINDSYYYGINRLKLDRVEYKEPHLLTDIEIFVLDKNFEPLKFNYGIDKLIINLVVDFF